MRPAGHVLTVLAHCPRAGLFTRAASSDIIGREFVVLLGSVQVLFYHQVQDRVLLEQSADVLRGM